MKYFTQTRKIFQVIFLTALLASSAHLTIAQVDSCGFDDYLEQMLQDNPEMEQMMMEMEEEMQQMMAHHPQAIMDGSVYTIPVVFHVIHLGNGTPSDLPASRINTALQHLNDDFRDVDGLGYDTKIQFCLAQRDPQGNPTNGINWANGTGVDQYPSLGIAPGINEAEVKALSNWPNTDYLNIWIVHEIAGSTVGYATFPVAPDATDGIVLEDNVTGLSAQSGVITHEAGHFLDLYHTFHGQQGTTCPPSGDCDSLGDKICDIPPHLSDLGNCDSTGTNPCDGGSSNQLWVHNYMSYANNSCRYEFSEDQVMRMRAALMMARSSLTNSLGCLPACESPVADFDVPAVEFQYPVDVTFTNTSTNADSFSWKIDGVQVSTDSNLIYSFNAGGVFYICLDAAGPDCINRKCTTITVIPVCQPPADPCEHVVNGDFEQIDASETNPNDFTAVCGWRSILRTPFFCNDDQNNSLGLYFVGNSNNISWSERVTTENPIHDGSGPFGGTISFDYWVTCETFGSGCTPPKIEIGLVDNNTPAPQEDTLPADATIIAEVTPSAVNDPSQNNHNCHEPGAEFHHYSTNFVSYDPDDVYLTVSGIPNSGFTVVYIDNISIDSCTAQTCNPIPDIDYEIDECTARFYGMNTGDEGDEYLWNFGDGSEATGDTVTHDYLYGGTFDVCLTITCDQENSETYCEEITIPDTCNQCSTDTLSINAKLCEEDSTGTDTWWTNFTMEVPNGYEPCSDQFYMDSEDGTIAVTSWSIDESPDNHDLIEVAALITPDGGIDFEADGITGHITLCGGSEQDMICYVFEAGGQLCNECIDIEQPPLATCNDPDPFDSTYVYTGSVTVDGIPDGASLCEDSVTALETGFTIDTVTKNGSEWTIDYTLTTEQAGAFNTAVFLCFNHLSTIYCATATLSVDPCIPQPPPEDCIEIWQEKTMSCDTIVNFEEGMPSEYAVFNISMQDVENSGYELCDGELIATVEGDGFVEVNSVNVTPGSMDFDIDIFVPTPIDSSDNPHIVRLFLCDEKGNMICYLFLLNLNCDTGLGGQKGYLSKDHVQEEYLVYPNPTSKYIELVDNKKTEEKIERNAVFLDRFGREVHQARLLSGKERVNVERLIPGVYFVRIIEGGTIVQHEKILIIR